MSKLLQLHIGFTVTQFYKPYLAKYCDDDDDDNDNNNNNPKQIFTELSSVRFTTFKAMTILMTFFWVETPCGLVSRSQCFGEACCLHLQG
jgi:hypothetical protein